MYEDIGKQMTNRQIYFKSLNVSKHVLELTEHCN